MRLIKPFRSGYLAGAGVGAGKESRLVGWTMPAPQADVGTGSRAALYSGGYEHPATAVYALRASAVGLNHPFPAKIVALDPGEVYVGPGMVIGVAVCVYCGR